MKTLTFGYQIVINGSIDIPNTESQKELVQDIFNRLASKCSLPNSEMHIALVTQDNTKKIYNKKFNNSI